MTTTNRYLIVNADDFGQSECVNRGIIEAHEHGIVTSTSLMVRWPAAAAAAEYAKSHATLGVGIHLDFGEWACHNGEWRQLYDVVPVDDPAAVEAEVERQLATFTDLVGRPPTHIDSHQHCHRKEPLRAAALAAAERLGVPLRSHTPWVSYCGAFYGQGDDGTPYHELISVDGLAKLLAGLPSGVTELGCHPAAGSDLDAMYRTEREIETRTLCAPRIRSLIDELGIELCNFERLGAWGTEKRLAKK